MKSPTTLSFEEYLALAPEQKDILIVERLLGWTKVKEETECSFHTPGAYWSYGSDSYVVDISFWAPPEVAARDEEEEDFAYEWAIERGPLDFRQIGQAMSIVSHLRFLQPSIYAGSPTTEGGWDWTVRLSRTQIGKASVLVGASSFEGLGEAICKAGLIATGVIQSKNYPPEAFVVII